MAIKYEMTNDELHDMFMAMDGNFYYPMTMLVYDKQEIYGGIKKEAQQKANRAWERLSHIYGFQYISARPIKNKDLTVDDCAFFFASPRKPI